MTPENFDHPCKNTCSGWQQGFNRGVESQQKRIDELKNIVRNREMREDLLRKEIQNSNPKTRQCVRRLRKLWSNVKMVTRLMILIISIKLPDIMKQLPVKLWRK